MRGEVAVLLFDDHGVVQERHELVAGGKLLGIEIPPGAWHTLVARQPTVLFELKQGPYNPLSDKDFASWAPAEGEALSAPCEAWFQHARQGQTADFSAPNTP